MQTAHNANGFVSIGINFGVTVLCVIPTWIVLSELEYSHEGLDEGSQDSKPTSATVTAVDDKRS